MNALFYLVSFFLLTSAGVFGFDLPGTLLVERQDTRSVTGAGYFVSVPDSLHARTVTRVPAEFDTGIDRDQHTLREPVSAQQQSPAPTAPPQSQPSAPAPLPTPSVAEREPVATERITQTGAITSVGSNFTTQAIVNATNNERIKVGLTPLLVDAGLTTMARAKVDDMIRYDYFDHVSPSGVDLAQLARQVGYEYILIGENLAYGNFSDPQSIVDAWMDSPGHRANILSTSYTHIGVSVRQAQFRGITAWVAVQEFSIPANACVGPNASISAIIASNRAQLEAYQAELTERDSVLSSTPTSSSVYNTLVAEYNALVVQFRELADRHNAVVNTYNDSVREHRACVESLL